MPDFEPYQVDMSNAGWAQNMRVNMGDPNAIVPQQSDNHLNDRQNKMDYYQQLGNALMQMMQAQQQPQQNQGGSGYLQPNLAAGFDSEWLMSQTNAASANGGTIGGGGGGSPGGGGGEKKGNFKMSGPQGGWGDSGGMGGFSEGATAFA